MRPMWNASYTRVFLDMRLNKAQWEQEIVENHGKSVRDSMKLEQVGYSPSHVGKKKKTN